MKVGAQFGHLVSEETREKIRQAHKGKKLTEEHKKKIREEHRKNDCGKWMKDKNGNPAELLVEKLTL